MNSLKIGNIILLVAIMFFGFALTCCGGGNEKDTIALKKCTSENVVCQKQYAEERATSANLRKKLIDAEKEIDSLKSKVEEYKQTSSVVYQELVKKLDGLSSPDAIMAAMKEFVVFYRRFPNSPEVEALRKIEAQLKAELAKIKKQEQLAAKQKAYQEIADSIKGVSSLDEVEQYLEKISAFRSKYPKTKEAKKLKRAVSGLKKTRSKLRKKEAKERAMKALDEIRAKLTDVEDGSSLAALQAIMIAAHLKSNNTKYKELLKLPRGSFSEAMKDPEGERGKILRVSGKVVQIQKEADYFTGIICADRWCNKVVYFTTPGTTKGIVANRWAKFAGVITQRYSYSNVTGGQTHSILAVGYFKGQE